MKKESAGTFRRNRLFVAVVLFLVVLVLPPLFMGNETELRIAVASNFQPVMSELVERYNQKYGKGVSITAASSGSLFAQIQNGANFDIFFSADEERAKRLEDIADMPAFIYAEGRLALWYPDAPAKNGTLTEWLAAGGKLAMADSALAPYGMAAVQTLKSLQLHDSLREHIVQGKNVRQALQFVHSGNATRGLVAFSHLLQLKEADTYMIVPSELHDPIRQFALVLKPSVATEAFLRFLRMDESIQFIENSGYTVP